MPSKSKDRIVCMAHRLSQTLDIPCLEAWNGGQQYLHSSIGHDSSVPHALGRGTDGRRYPWGNDEEYAKRHLKKRELIADTNGVESVVSQVATASPYGVSDLIGRVSEWVKDWYAEDFYQASSTHDPQGPSRGSFRVLRGGEWNEKSPNLQVSYRGWDDATYWGPTLGVRCAEEVL